MKPIDAAEFKDQCLSILNQLDDEGIVITKGGKPVARLIPIRDESGDLIGALEGKLRIKGDIISIGVRWRAQRWSRPASSSATTTSTSATRPPR